MSLKNNKIQNKQNKKGPLQLSKGPFFIYRNQLFRAEFIVIIIAAFQLLRNLTKSFQRALYVF